MSTPISSFRLPASLAAVALFFLAGLPARALNPSLPPSGNFDLTNFNLQWYACSGSGESSGSPIGVNNPAYLYTGPDGAMTFWCPDGGGCTSSSNTHYQRTELEDKTLWFVTDAVDHKMTASCKVLLQPSNGSLIIGQIHGTTPSSGSELLKFRWMSGSIVAGVKTTVSATEVYHTITSANLGDTIAYTFDEFNHVVTVTVSINGGASLSYQYTPDATWNNDPLYFKAGDYVQDDSSSTTDGGKVAFYGLQVTTGGSGPQQVSAPQFSPGGGTYSIAQNISVTSATSGASIRYTLNGSAPSESNGTLYSGPVNISSTATLQALAYKTGLTDSNITSATYTIGLGGTVAPPTYSPGGGTYTSAQTVTISDSTSGATIHYTTNGSTPTASSTVYSGPITISSTTTLEALGVKSGDTNSSVASATYTIVLSTPVVATPTFSPVAGTYTSAQKVTISDSTSGATIYYTTNGKTPTTKSTKYSSSISVSKTTTLEALGVKSGDTNSSVASAIYTIK